MTELVLENRHSVQIAVTEPVTLPRARPAAPARRNARPLTTDDPKGQIRRRAGLDLATVSRRTLNPATGTTPANFDPPGDPAMNVQHYAQHSAYTDPGPYGALLDELPTDIPALSAIVRNVLLHYRGAGLPLPGERLAEINNRWVDRILATDQQRSPGPLTTPRPLTERVAGCCRDFTLLTVAALRQHGVPARSRIGFADYFTDASAPDFHHDHVITEYWNGARWVYTDTQLDPDGGWAFDPYDMPVPGGSTRLPFASAAQVWTAFRAGTIRERDYGVLPGDPIGGGWLILDYVLQELAHRQREELLLWDVWGDMAENLDGDLGLIDDIAALLLAADAGDEAAERELAHRYRTDPRLHPAGKVRCMSPAGADTIVSLAR
jgi:transglutaminase-like putative cysteine protease